SRLLPWSRPPPPSRLLPYTTRFRSGSDQVTIKARVIEVQRSAVKQLGVDVNALVQGVGDGLSFVQNATFAVSGSQLGGGVLGYDDGALATSLRAFERAGLVRTLADPTVTSVHGETAEFL